MVAVGKVKRGDKGVDDVGVEFDERCGMVLIIDVERENRHDKASGRIGFYIKMFWVVEIVGVCVFKGRIVFVVEFDVVFVKFRTGVNEVVAGAILVMDVDGRVDVGTTVFGVGAAEHGNQGPTTNREKKVGINFIHEWVQG